jgi:hypothetical protein
MAGLRRVQAGVLEGWVGGGDLGVGVLSLNNSTFLQLLFYRQEQNSANISLIQIKALRSSELVWHPGRQMSSFSPLPLCPGMITLSGKYPVGA